MLSCLANICTQEIALETIDLIMGLINHTKPLIRKKAIALLAKVFIVAPELIPNNFDKLLVRMEGQEDNTSIYN